MTTFPPVLGLCAPEWDMLLILWLIITPPAVKGHILDANPKRGFWSGSVPADIWSFQVWWVHSSVKVEQPGLMSAERPVPPPFSPDCVRAINHYQVLIPSNDFEKKKKKSIYVLLVSLRFAGEKQKETEIFHSSLSHFNFHQMLDKICS